MWEKLFWPAALMLVGLLISSCKEQGLEEKNTTQKDLNAENKIQLQMPGAVPPDGKTLLFIGQDLGSVAGYVNSGKFPVPAGTVTYAYPMDSAGGLLPNRSYWGCGPMCLDENAKHYPNSLIALGMSLVEKDEKRENLNKLLRGEFDDYLDIAAKTIQRANRPVYVRIGYEFDGIWNHYDPEEYKSAFKYVYQKIKPVAGANFISVWQASTSPVGVILDSVINKIKNKPIEPWYPGDEYVDWIGYSWFLSDEKQHDLTQDLCDFARKKGKPVMLCESAVQGYELDLLTKKNIGGLYDGYPGDDMRKVTSEEIWENWFQPYFNFIYKNTDVIKAVCYINCDWDHQPLWGKDNVSDYAPRGYAEGYWGDTRIEVNEYISKKWLEEISKEGWLMADDIEFPAPLEK